MLTTFGQSDRINNIYLSINKLTFYSDSNHEKKKPSNTLDIAESDLLIVLKLLRHKPGHPHLLAK